MSVRTRPLRSGDAGQDVSRYDLLLAVLPLPMFVGFAAGALPSFPSHASVGAGALLSALLVAYGLFYDAPESVEG